MAVRNSSWLFTAFVNTYIRRGIVFVLYLSLNEISSRYVYIYSDAVGASYLIEIMFEIRFLFQVFLSMGLNMRVFL